jgi:hypothetical protein
MQRQSAGEQLRNDLVEQVVGAAIAAIMSRSSWSNPP